MKISKSFAFLSGFTAALVVWWLTLFFAKITDGPFALAYAFAYGLIPLFGGFFGMRHAKDWGMFRSTMGKALFFFSLGLISWGVGEMIWSYYNFVLHVEIPYPGLADIAFVLSWPLWGVGLWFISFATGARYGLKDKLGRLKAFILPILAAIFSYYLLIVVARGGVIPLDGDLLKVFFDIAYPLFDLLVIALGAVVYGLSFKYLGGRYKWAVVLTLSGFILNYFADFGFSYTTTVGTFHNGNWVDLLFTAAMFVISAGVNSFTTKSD